MRIPKSPLPVAFLALTYADMGRMEEARAMAQKVLEVSPGFTVKGFVNILTFKTAPGPSAPSPPCASSGCRSETQLS